MMMIMMMMMNNTIKASIHRHAKKRLTVLLQERLVRTFSTGQTELTDPNIVTINIDGVDVASHKSMTVLQACEQHGVHIPRFCYHDRLSIAGNCRMCLVEVVKSPKPVASCAMPLLPGMQIKTNTPLVKKAREGVMEFLLANHPLDCPICDQGGECDLQDLSMYFGSDRGRYNEFKRSVEDKQLGPFVKTIMTRCIHCTRCVRFADEIAGVPDLGVTGRGNAMEIGTYVDKYFDSELSGNVVDLCPVGALTSKPFAFTARPWELIKTESIDVHDALGSAIRVDTRGQRVMRVQPRLNDEVNEEWLSDRSRYSYDGLSRQRLDSPMMRRNGSLTEVTWPEAIEGVANQLKSLQGNQIRALVGDLVDAEAMITLKDWMNRLGCGNIECRENGTDICADHRSHYMFNSRISGIDKADVLLLVGTNPRMESPLLNARIRRAVVHGGMRVISIGPKANLNYDFTHLGDDAAIFGELASGKHKLCSVLADAKHPMLILGESVLKRSDANAFKSAIENMAQYVPLFNHDWNGFNILHLTASRVAGLDLGLVPDSSADLSDVKFVYLLGADSFADNDIDDNAFVVYQGHHGDKGASRANIILPGNAYTEKSGTYVNMEGRVQRTCIATTSVGQARPDWCILRALSEVCGVQLAYSSLEGVRNRLADVAPHLAHVGTIESAMLFPLRHIEATNNTNTSSNIEAGCIEPIIDNFFLTNVICRASRNMVKGSVDLPNSANSYV